MPTEVELRTRYPRAFKDLEKLARDGLDELLLQMFEEASGRFNEDAGTVPDQVIAIVMRKMFHEVVTNFTP